MIPTSLHLLLLLLTLLSIRYWHRLYQTRTISSIFPLTTDRRYLELSPPVVLALLWIALQLTTTISKIISPSQTPSKPLTLEDISSFCAITFSFGLVLVLILKLLNSDGMPGLGFRWKDRVGQLRDGAVGFLLALLPVMALLLLTFPFRTEEVLHPFFQLLKARPEFTTVLWIFISAVVVAPLFEELIYRVIFQSWLESRFPPFVSILISAFVFSIVHGFPDCIPLFPLAYILGLLFYCRRSYIANVITHSLFNAINLALAMASQPPAA